MLSSAHTKHFSVLGIEEASIVSPNGKDTNENCGREAEMEIERQRVSAKGALKHMSIGIVCCLRIVDNIFVVILYDVRYDVYLDLKHLGCYRLKFKARIV